VLDFQDVYQRITAPGGDFEGRPQEYFTEQLIAAQFDLAAYGGGVFGSVSGQTLQFPVGTVIVGLAAGGAALNQASTQVDRAGLEMFTIGITVNNNRTLVGPGQALASTVFGRENDLFPAKEIVIANTASMVVSLTSVMSDAIRVWLTAHCFVPVRG
jgi:hypothetical protein